MNFLAHCALADAAGASLDHTDREALIVGAVYADFCKGPIPAALAPSLQLGFRLHRRIDATAGRHPAVQRACDRFPAPLRRFAPIFVDLFGDYALHRAWQHHHDDALETFCARCYELLSGADIRPPIVSERAATFVEYACDTDLFAAYGSWDGVEKGLYGVCRRLQRRDLRQPALAAMQQLENQLQADFASFYPDLKVAAQDFVNAAQ